MHFADAATASTSVPIKINTAPGTCVPLSDYDDLFDVSCYSCELGVAKPEAAFFAEAARLIGAPPQTILFIDDNAENIDGARVAGLAADRWDHGQGQPSLLGLLAEHGIELPSVPGPAESQF